MTFLPVSSRTTSAPSGSKFSSEHLITETSHLSRTTSTQTPTEQTSLATTTEAASSSSTPTSTSAPPKLSKGQIVGISVAGVFGSACVIGLVVLLIYYCHQRRKAKRGSHVPSRDSWGYKFERDNQSDKSPWKTSPSEGPRVTTQTYNRGSWRPSAIGYAVTKTPIEGHAGIPPVPVTPRDGPLTPKRPVSKLLPERPDMNPSHTSQSVVVSHVQNFPASQHQPSNSHANKSLPPVQPSIRPVPPTFTITAPSTSSFNGPDNTQHSTAQTERAPALPKLVIPKTRNVIPPQEARESNITEFEDDNPSSAQTTANNQQYKNGAYNSGQNYYVADRQGNWTRADAVVNHSVVELSSQAVPNSQVSRAVPPPAQKPQETVPRFKTPAPIQVVPAASIPAYQLKVMPSPLFSRSVSAPVVNRSKAAEPQSRYDDTTQEIVIAPPHATLPPAAGPQRQHPPFALPYPVGRADGTGSPAPRLQGIPPPRRPIQYNMGSPRSVERQYPYAPQDIVRGQPPVRIPNGALPSQNSYEYNRNHQDDRSNLPSVRPQQRNGAYPRRGPGPNPNGLPYPRDRDWLAQQSRYDRPYYPQSYNPHGRPQQRPPQQRPTQQYSDPHKPQVPLGPNASQLFQADQPSPNSLLSKRRGPTMANDMMLTPTMTPTTQSLWQRESHRYPSV